jgi:S1-C subfamily serine protease
MTMDKKVTTKWRWALMLLALLVAGLLATVTAAATQSRTATPTYVSATATVAPALAAPEGSQAAFDEQQAANVLEAQIIDVYNDAGPAVVNITNRSYVTYRFMGTVPEEGTGSGFVYDTEGRIVTNYHVIEGADELLVTLANGHVYDATIVGSDPTNDLAVIQIDAGADLPQPLRLGDSDKVQVGQFVVAIGNPFGLQQTLTTGVVSALGRVIESPESNQFIGEAIQTDAAINPGNSGGPMLDLHGQVIGINSQIISPSGASAGIGFAVSVNTVRRVVPTLIAQGYYPHPWLGADMTPLSSNVVELLRQAGAQVPMESGLLVLDTTAGGPADQAGIHGGNQTVRVGRYRVPVGGDVIVALDGQPVADLQTLTVYLETEKAIGDTVEVNILRDGQALTVSVTLGEEPRG